MEKEKVNPREIYKFTLDNMDLVPRGAQNETIVRLEEAKKLAEITMEGIQSNATAKDFVALQVIAHISKEAAEMEYQDIMKFSATYYELCKSENKFLNKLGEILGGAIDAGYSLSRLKAQELEHS